MNKILRPVRGNYVLTYSYDDHVKYQKEHPNIIYNAGNDFYSDDRNIYTCDTGKVDKIGYDPQGYGNYIKMKHPWGYSLYAHLLEQPQFPIGFEIARGLIFATMGYSGNVRPSGPAGTHLHFETRDQNNTVFNPERYYIDYVQGSPQAVSQNKNKEPVGDVKFGRVRVIVDNVAVRNSPGITGTVLTRANRDDVFLSTDTVKPADGLNWRLCYYPVYIAENDGSTNLIEKIE